MTHLEHCLSRDEVLHDFQVAVESCAVQRGVLILVAHLQRRARLDKRKHNLQQRVREVGAQSGVVRIRNTCVRVLER